MQDQIVLETDNLSKRFGGVAAVTDVSIALTAGEIVGLIGPNGAGKTTLVNLLTGVLTPTSGRVRFEGADVTRQKSHQAARRGIARTFQIVQPFPSFSVLDNVAAACLFAQGLKSVPQAREDAQAHLEFVGLGGVRDQAASALTLPNRKRLELAKSLAMNPRVLLLDEVNAGLNPTEIDEALNLIRRIADRGVTILIIEHLMKVVFSLSERILVMHQGAIVADGPPDEIAQDEKVISAYLGKRYSEKLSARDD